MIKRLEMNFTDEDEHVIQVGDVVTITDTLFAYYVTGEVTSVFSKNEDHPSSFAIAIGDFHAHWESFVTKGSVHQCVRNYTLIPGHDWKFVLRPFSST